MTMSLRRDAQREVGSRRGCREIFHEHTLDDIALQTLILAEKDRVPDFLRPANALSRPLPSGTGRNGSSTRCC